MADRHDGHEDDDERKVRKGPVLVSTLLGGEESWRLRDTCSRSAYLYLRQGTDPELVEVDRATYLRKVIMRRKELEEELRKQ